MQYFGTGRLGPVQNVAYSATAGTTSAVGTETYKVRVATTSDAWVVIGNGIVATTTTGSLMPGGSTEYFTCTPGQIVSAVQVSAGGTLNVTEIV